METYVIVIIVIVVLLVLAGAGVGLYFLFRKTPNAGAGGSGSNGGGSNGNCPNYPDYVAPANPPGFFKGNKNFLIGPASDSTLFMTLGTDAAQNIVLQTRSPADNICEYVWTNDNVTENSTKGQINITNALIWGGGYNSPDKSTISRLMAYNQPRGICLDIMVDIPLSESGGLGKSIQNWTYNPTSGTWCGIGNQSSYCLYHNPDNSVTVKPYNSTDKGFQWNVYVSTQGSLPCPGFVE